MWIKDSVDIEVARNTTTPIGFQLWDEVSQLPLDITGFSFTCSIALADGEKAIISHNVDISDAENGEFNIVFDGRSYQAVPGMKELSKATYQIIADDGDAPVTALRGAIFIVPGI